MAVKPNASRLWRDIHETARIGATPRGGLCRLALSDEDRRVRDWLVGACREQGCAVRVDALGNVFARRAGRRAELAPIAIGSHLDSQPTGGKFDGVLGVLAGLEVVRTLNEHGIETEHPIEVIDWTNEEGARFAPAMLGSGVFARALDETAVLDTRDREGRALVDELERIGYRGTERCGDHPLDSYFELHIEQGPILEAEQKAIGVVDGVQGMRWYDVSLEGRASHAGTTPMALRRDAGVAAAELIVGVRRLVEALGRGALATAGVIDAYPNSRNVVPSRVFVTIDLRNPTSEGLDHMEQALREIVAQCGARQRVEARVERIWDSPPVRFDDACVAAVRQAATARGLAARDITSGAGHDAVYVSRVAPTAMIFVPCRDGVSHNELESATAEHVEAGASVLLDSVLFRDRHPD